MRLERPVLVLIFAALAAGSPTPSQALDDDLLRVPPAFRSWVDPSGPLGELGPRYPVSAELALARTASPMAALAPRRSWLRSWGPTLLLAATHIVLERFADPPADPRWSSKNSFDTRVRRGLVASSRDTRDDADLASDILFGTLGAALLADWVWLRDEYGFSESARTELSWILGGTISTRVLKLSAGRARPYVDPCSIDSSYISDCNNGRDDNASFYSGHASSSATFAGLLCARHLHRAQRSRVDLAVCGTAIAGTMATGFTRIIADKHWYTDVLAGWVTGALFGYVLPVHFQFGQNKPGEPPMMGLHGFTPAVGTRFFGLRYQKRF
jgi:membrane-associated phospholipid phosphatase